jgi:hypothetical protein
VTERDTAIMAAVGEDLLVRPTIGLESAASRRYALSVAVAGYLLQGRRAEAVALWERFERGTRTEKDAPMGIEMRFLQAHTLHARWSPGRLNRDEVKR